jgi:orotidine-5'-phosphate decarboxylase
LAPGIGAQGGKIADLPDNFGAAYLQVLPMIGRALLAAGPNNKNIAKQLTKMR